MKYFDSASIGKAAPIDRWVNAMEQALIDVSLGLVDVPERMHIDKGSNTLLLMPCFGKEYFATKLVSVFPKNHLKKMPVIAGTVVLNDVQNGQALAIMDGAKLTAMRTAAVGALGIRYLASKKASTLGIIGLGIQGFHQALFACLERKVKTLRIIDHSSEVMDRFEEKFLAYYPEIEVIKCKHAGEICAESEIIITATGSHRPVVPENIGWCKGKTLVGIGSYKPKMKEFPDSIFSELKQVYVDTPQAIVESGDLRDPLEKGIIQKEQVIPLSDLIRGNTQLQGETHFFKSVGMAAFDLYGAKLVYEHVQEA